MHVAYVKQLRLYHREGHSWVLDTAIVRVCLMSQRADGRPMRTTAPHAASYFEGQSQKLSKQKLPWHTPSSAALSLEVTDFEAGWPVIDSHFK